MHSADKLAEELLSQGKTGMKVWPFDFYAELPGGHHISEHDLHKVLETFRKISSISPISYSIGLGHLRHQFARHLGA